MTVKLPGPVPYLRLVHSTPAPITPAANGARPAADLFLVGARPPVPDLPGPANGPARRFASSAEGAKGQVFFVGKDIEARVQTIRQMKRGMEIEAGIRSDLDALAEVKIEDKRELRLEYLRGVMEAVDMYAHSGPTLDAREIVRAMHLIASEAFKHADFISVKKVEHIPLSEHVSSMMGRITSCADHLERRIIARNAMDQPIAEQLAHIYFVTAVKGAGGDAVRQKRISGPASPVYRAHVANALLRLLDAQERFARLGKEQQVREAMKAVTTLFVHHDVPTNGRQWAIGVAADFLRKNVDLMYAAEGNKREELHDTFVNNVQFFTYGNRQFAPSILVKCEEALAEKGDEPLRRLFHHWAWDETYMSKALTRI